MIVDLINLEDSLFKFDFTLEPGEIDLSDEAARLKTPVAVKGELKKGIVETTVAGTIAAEVVFDCTRCLAEVERRLEFPFTAAFVAPEHYTAAREAELGAEDLDTSVIEGSRIDLGELVREQLLLNLPEQVFCREDCRGLCAKCGANRNATDCGCEEKEIDPRWAGLKNLM
jgi:uncharacterized protein